MLGGLARWLRVYGYDATWTYGIDDWDLIRHARAENRFLLSCDTRMFEIGVLRDGELPGLLLPVGLKKLAQFRYVIGALKLPQLPTRCMACGGELHAVAKESVRARIPPRTAVWLDDYFECRRCQKLLWKGTHWRRIAETLATAGVR